MNLMDYYRNVIGKSLFKSTHKIDNYTISMSKIEPDRLNEIFKNNISDVLGRYILNEIPDSFKVINDGEVTRMDCELVVMTKERFIEIFKDISDGRR